MSNEDNKSIVYLSIRELLDAKNGKYIIPIYQRNYAWGKLELEQLIDDVYEASIHSKDKSYYIGSLVVYKRKNGDYEVIDGQQRLTSLTILYSVLSSKDELNEQYKNLGNNLNFEHREESKQALDKILKQGNINKRNNIELAYSIIDDKLASLKIDNITEFQNFLFTHVKILRTEVLPNTDLNHYFEIMNSRGEQLEKHEVLKAHFMGMFKNENEDEDGRKLFSMIWDACSDMDRSVVMGFESDFRKKVFFSDLDEVQENFNCSQTFDGLKKVFKGCFTDNKDNPEKTNSNTLKDILGNPNKYIKNEKDEKNKDVNTRSIIDFSNFLMQVLKLYRDNESVSLDDKKLISAFKSDLTELNDVKNFIMFLLNARLSFDKYIIKYTQSSIDDWYLMIPKIGKNKNNSNYFYYVNTFEDNDQKEVILLLSMFQTIYTQRTNKNWLYDVMKWLQSRNWLVDNVREYVIALENLAYKYANKIINFDTLKQDLDKIKSELDNGTKVGHFIFSYLDYLIYKKAKDSNFWIKNEILPNEADKVNEEDFKNLKKYFDNFKFSYRSSIEHCYPQNLNRDKLKSLEKWEGSDVDFIDAFGNLCLIEPEFNSSLSDNGIQLKRSKLIELLKKNDKRAASLKQVIMLMYKDECWEFDNAKNTIKEHREKMLKLLLEQCKEGK
nr:DUF262 domain-containing protein [uncultured Haemophilus sp.]